MQAGLLRYNITFVEPVILKDDYGSEATVWQTFKTARSDIKYNTGSRDLQNSEIVYNSNVSFIIRYYHEINEKMRIIYDSKKYRIISIEADQRLQKKSIITELINE